MPAAPAVTLKDVEASQPTVYEAAWRTPCLPAGRDESALFVKAECLQRLGSFKIRGIWNRMAATSPAERAAGFVTVSAGNAGQAVAWAARRMGAPCTVWVPQGAAKPKLESIRAMGARIVVRPHEEIMDAMTTPDFPASGGATYVHPFGHPKVVAGHGTIGLEILEAVPEVGTVCVAVGGGGLSSGIATALKGRRPQAKVIGVQAATAGPLPVSFRTGRPERVDPGPTIGDGMRATRVFDYMWPLLRERLDDAVHVTEEELAAAVRHLARECHLVAEGAGAAALAAAWKLRGTVPEPIVAVVSGGNIDPALHGRLVGGA